MTSSTATVTTGSNATTARYDAAKRAHSASGVATTPIDSQKPTISVTPA